MDILANPSLNKVWLEITSTVPLRTEEKMFEINPESKSKEEEIIKKIGRLKSTKIIEMTTCRLITI